MSFENHIRYENVPDADTRIRKDAGELSEFVKAMSFERGISYESSGTRLGGDCTMRSGEELQFDLQEDLRELIQHLSTDDDPDAEKLRQKAQSLLDDIASTDL